MKSCLRIDNKTNEIICGTLNYDLEYVAPTYRAGVYTNRPRECFLYYLIRLHDCMDPNLQTKQNRMLRFNAPGNVEHFMVVFIAHLSKHRITTNHT